MLAIAPFVAFAQSGKIAYVNTNELFSIMPEIPGIEDQIEKKQQEIRKSGEALIEEFQKKNEEFQKTFETASESAKADMQRQLEQIEERYTMFQQNSNKEMQELSEKLIAPVQDKIAKAIKAVGDEKGYAYILDVATQQSPIVYIHDTTEDATPLVKSKLGIQ